MAYACGRVRLIVIRIGGKEYYINCDSGKVYESLGEAEAGEC